MYKVFHVVYSRKVTIKLALKSQVFVDSVRKGPYYAYTICLIDRLQSF